MNGLFRFVVFAAALMLITFNATSGMAALVEEQKGQAVKHLTLEEIVVTDETVKEPAVTVVGVKTIEKGKNTSIPDVLKYEAEIDVSRRALVGDTGDILSIRGLSGNRIMLNIDGRSVNAAGVQGGYFIDWSTIPLDNIEKIEIMKGGSLVKYGNNAGGGVINVITKKPTAQPTLTFYGNYGWAEDINGMQNYRLTHTYKIGPVGYSIAGSYQKAAEFLWNNDYTAKNLSGKLYIDMPINGELILGLQYTNVERGFAILNRMSSNPDDPKFNIKRNPDFPLSFGESFSPGAGNVTTPGEGAYWKKIKYLLDLGYKQPIGNAVIEFKVYKNYEDRDEKNYSANWINSNYPNGRLVLDRTVKSDRSYGGSVEFMLPMASHEILAGVERKVISTGGQDVHFVDTSYGATRPVTNSTGQSAYMWGVYLQDTWSVSDKFLITPGIRYDTYDSTQTGLGSDMDIKENGFSMSLTGTYKLTVDDVVTASIYRKFLTPSAPDSWWWYEGYVGGLYKTPLKLEKNNAIELAYRHNFSAKTHVRFSVYHYSINDFIRRFSIPTGRGCYNIDKVALTGASVDASAGILSWFSAFGNITYQKTKKEGDVFDSSKLTDKLDYTPQWKGNIGLDFKLPYNASLSARQRFVGSSYTVYSFSAQGKTNYKLVKLGSYSTMDAEIKIPVTKNSEFGIYAENIFDKKYEERFGYPMTGRVIGAALKLTL